MNTQAIEQPSRGARAPQPSPSLPSLAALMRARVAAFEAKHLADVANLAAPEGTREARAADAEFLNLEAQQTALFHLAATMPVRTLEDAIAAVCLASEEVEALSAHEVDQHDVETAARKLLRLLDSALPVLAKLGGVDLATLVGEQTSELIRSRGALQ